METIEFFQEHKTIFVIGHVLSVISGMGAALVSDVMFNMFLKGSRQISASESKILYRLSGMIWVSIFLIVATGTALFFSAPDFYAHSDKFLLKMTIVLGIIANGIVFWLYLHPKLTKIKFGEITLTPRLERARSIAFASGAFSFVSWLAAFVLGSISTIPVNYKIGLAVYLVISAGAIMVSQFMKLSTAKTGK